MPFDVDSTTIIMMMPVRGRVGGGLGAGVHTQGGGVMKKYTCIQGEGVGSQNRGTFAHVLYERPLNYMVHNIIETL